jgi:hypothetical protein
LPKACTGSSSASTNGIIWVKILLVSRRNWLFH